MADGSRFTHLLGGQVVVRPDGISADEAIARLAARQFGAVMRAQLVALGVSARSVEVRLVAGRLRRVHPGVYAVGHDALSFEGRAMAAVMAVWPGAAASFGTAGALCGLDLPTSGPVHVTATKARRQKAGVVVHRGALPHDEVRWVRGIPVTTVPRTLLDLSATEGPLRLRRLAKDCEFKGLVSFAAIDAILERYPRRRGRRNLAELARGTHRRSGRTRSALEDLFSDFVEKRKLPPPERNVAVRAGGRTMEVDCVWRDARLALELDGRSAHAIEAAFELDRERDRALLAAGWKPMRATWRQVQSGAALERDIRAVLTNGA